MDIRRGWPMIAAAVLSSTVVFAQSNAQAPREATSQANDNDGTPITLVGCLQREAEYRRTHDTGRGGVAGTGLGRGNEYVLINASRMGSAGAAPQASIDCSSFSTDVAYELTGEREPDLEPFVGRVVRISGMLKEAETEPVGTSGRTAPTGGVDPLGQDLRLHEVNVTSFQEVATAAQAPSAAQPAPAAEPQPTATTGAEDQLPR